LARSVVTLYPATQNFAMAIHLAQLAFRIFLVTAGDNDAFYLLTVPVLNRKIEFQHGVPPDETLSNERYFYF
jgi:hypothetical protein